MNFTGKRRVILHLYKNYQMCFDLMMWIRLFRAFESSKLKNLDPLKITHLTQKIRSLKMAEFKIRIFVT